MCVCVRAGGWVGVSVFVCVCVRVCVCVCTRAHLSVRVRHEAWGCKAGLYSVQGTCRFEAHRAAAWLGHSALAVPCECIC